MDIGNREVRRHGQQSPAYQFSICVDLCSTRGRDRPGDWEEAFELVTGRAMVFDGPKDTAGDHDLETI